MDGQRNVVKVRWTGKTTLVWFHCELESSEPAGQALPTFIRSIRLIDSND